MPQGPKCEGKMQDLPKPGENLKVPVNGDLYPAIDLDIEVGAVSATPDPTGDCLIARTKKAVRQTDRPHGLYTGRCRRCGCSMIVDIIPQQTQNN